MSEITKQTNKRDSWQLLNSRVSGENIICNVRLFWNETEIDEHEIIEVGGELVNVTYNYQYDTADVEYSIPGDTENIRAYLAANIFDVWRQYKKGELGNDYDTALAAGYILPTLGFKVKIAPANQLDWNSGLNLLNETQAENMIVRDFGESHTITAAQYKQMVVEIGSYVHSLMQNWWRVDDAVDAAETVDDIMAVAW